MNNPIIILLVILGVLVVISVVLFGIIKNPAKDTNTDKSFNPTIVGQVAQVHTQRIVQFITEMNPDQVRALLIINKNMYENKKSLMQRAKELYSLTDQHMFLNIYEQIFKPNKNKLAKADDVGGLLLTHYDNNRNIEVYTMSAVQEGAPIGYLFCGTHKIKCFSQPTIFDLLFRKKVDKFITFY